MPSVKCDNCGHSIEIEDATKKYKLPLFFITLGAAILGYENLVSNPSLTITVLGFLTGAVGLVWLIKARLTPIKADKRHQNTIT
jgi:hypothetical protein